jgi:hypothetical protein
MILPMPWVCLLLQSTIIMSTFQACWSKCWSPGTFGIIYLKLKLSVRKNIWSIYPQNCSQKFYQYVGWNFCHDTFASFWMLFELIGWCTEFFDVWMVDKPLKWSTKEWEKIWSNLFQAQALQLYQYLYIQYCMRTTSLDPCSFDDNCWFEGNLINPYT